MKFFKSLPFKLLVGVLLGLGIGLFAYNTTNLGVASVITNLTVTFNHLIGQVIMFCVPLIVIGFIAPSITTMGANASRMLGLALAIAYLSSILGAFFSMGVGYALIPSLNIQTVTEGLKELPALVFRLDIPQIMPVMSALVFSILVGLGATWTKSERIIGILNEFQNIVLDIVKKVVIPLLPIYIATTFANLAYEGAITTHLPVFLKVVLIVIVLHFIWMAVLYLVAALYTKDNPWEVIRHYGPAYITAVGTMSSAATLAVALEGAHKSTVLREDMVSFGVPLFSNIHLCGSVITEVFFVMVISEVLYNQPIPLTTMILFIILLGVFAVGAPGVPGGTVMASLGIVTGVLGFGDEGTALLLTIFALQDSFGTACNITGDGALTMILTGYANKHGIEENTVKEVVEG